LDSTVGETPNGSQTDAPASATRTSKWIRMMAWSQLWKCNNPYGGPSLETAASQANRPQQQQQQQLLSGAPQPTQNICRHYLLGKCNRGALCRFTHLEKHHVEVRYSRHAKGLSVSRELQTVLSSGASPEHPTVRQEEYGDAEAPTCDGGLRSSSLADPKLDSAASPDPSETRCCAAGWSGEGDGASDRDSATPTVGRQKDHDDGMIHMVRVPLAAHSVATHSSNGGSTSGGQGGCTHHVFGGDGLTPESSLTTAITLSGPLAERQYFRSPDATPQLIWRPSPKADIRSGAACHHHHPTAVSISSEGAYKGDADDEDVLLLTSLSSYLPAPALPLPTPATGPTTQHQPYGSPSCSVIGQTRDLRSHDPYGAYVLLEPDSARNRYEAVEDFQTEYVGTLQEEEQADVEEEHAMAYDEDSETEEEDYDQLPAPSSHDVASSSFPVSQLRQTTISSAATATPPGAFHPYPRPTRDMTSTRKGRDQLVISSASGRSETLSLVSHGSSPEPVTSHAANHSCSSGGVPATPTVSVVPSPPLNPKAAPFQPPCCHTQGNPLDDDADVAFVYVSLPSPSSSVFAAASTFGNGACSTPPPPSVWVSSSVRPNKRFQASAAFSSACTWPTGSVPLVAPSTSTQPSDLLYLHHLHGAPRDVDPDLAKTLKSLW